MLNQGYAIMKPIQLPWMFVSPSGLKGLDFHLAPDLFIRLEGIISGEQEFIVGHFVLQVEGFEVDELTAEQIFMNEYLPAKSKERINKAFKDGQNSCFFTMKQMEQLQVLFGAKNFMSYDVSVYYKDRKVEDVPSLPPDEFKKISKAFSELDVFGKDSWKETQQEREEKYDQVYMQKTAELEDKQKKSLWEKVKGKGMRKRAGFAFGTIVAGALAFVAQRKLADRGGILAMVGSVIVGSAAVILELYGSNEAGNVIKQLQYEGKSERMAF